MFLLLTVTILTLFITNIQYASGLFPPVKFISSYYKPQNITLVSSFICDVNYNMKLMKHLSNKGIQANILSPSNVNILLQDDYYKVGVLLDTSCPEIENILHEASVNRLFDHLHVWLMFSSKDFVQQSTETDIRNMIISVKEDKLFKNISVLLDSNVMWAVAMDSGISQISLLELYRPTDSLPLNVTLMAVAHQVVKTEEYDIIYKVKELPSRRRKNLHGVQVKAVSVMLYPDQFSGMEDLHDLSKRHIDTWSKISFPIFECLSQDMNFSMDVSFVDNFGWQTNGSFDGMMGVLQRGEADMLATAIFMREDRMLVVDYAAETTHLKTSAIFRQPSLSSVSNIFLLPFSRMVWLCCGGICILVILILGFQIITTTKEHVEKTMLHTSWADIVTLVLGANCQQGYHVAPETLSSRITVFVTFLASLFFFTSYSANIVALLQTPSAAIKTVADLTASPLAVAFQDILYNRVYLGESTDPIITKFREKKVGHQGEAAFIKNISKGVQKIRHGMFAFQVDSNMGYKEISETYTEQEKCGLAEVEIFPLPIMAVGVPKKSHLREIYAQRVRWQREVGIMQHLDHVWKQEKYRCENKISGFVSVGLVDFYPALLTLQYGGTIAVVLFLMEVIWHHRNDIFMMLLRNNSRHSEDVYTRRWLK